MECILAELQAAKLETSAAFGRMGKGIGRCQQPPDAMSVAVICFLYLLVEFFLFAFCTYL
jgi:hypothetical protein